VLEGRGLVQVGVVRVVAGGVAVVGRWRSGVEDLVVAEGELLLDLVAVGVGRGRDGGAEFVGAGSASHPTQCNIIVSRVHYMACFFSIRPLFFFFLNQNRSANMIQGVYDKVAHFECE
jgi:hypothetical protein